MHNSRDERLDFLRGLAIVGITINHIVPSRNIYDEFGHYQFGQYFFFNFADIFIFISGYLCGIAYRNYFISNGIIKSQIKANRRILQIYIAQTLAFLMCLALVLISRNMDGSAGFLGFSEYGLKDIFLGTVFLYSPIPYFNILNIYMLFLLFVPIFIFCYLKSRLLTLSFVFILYLIVQVQNPLSEIELFFVNPLAWQFLFFLGTAIGLEIKNNSFIRINPNYVVPFLIAYLFFGNYLQQMEFAYFHFNSKEMLGILRVSDLLAVLIIISIYMPKRISDKNYFLDLLTGIGRHSLTMFCVGLVVIYLCNFLIFFTEADRIVYFLVLLFAFIIMLFSYIILKEIHKRYGIV